MDDHLKLVRKCLKKLDKESSRKTYLGYKFSKIGVKPLDSEKSWIINLNPPTNMSRISIPQLRFLCHPLTPLLKKTEQFILTENHAIHFEESKAKISEATENGHHHPNLEIRVKFDQSQQGLGAALAQLYYEVRKLVAFASLFIISVETRYSVEKPWTIGSLIDNRKI